MINLILETDLPYINKIKIQQITKLKKLLYMLAINVPFIPNITDIAKATNISYALTNKIDTGSARELFFVNQIKDVPNSYVISDDIEIGFKNRIPLWIFGFLY